MNKLPMTTAAIVFAFAADGAVAACSGTQIAGNGLTTLLTNNTICGSRGGERWQEEHIAGGVLKDYKMGPSDAVDPTKQVGSWSVDEVLSQVTYQYGASTYVYEVWDNGGAPNKYSFCVASVLSVDNVTVETGVGIGCP